MTNGDLTLKQFLERARNNELATANNLPTYFAHLADVEELFRHLGNILDNPPDIVTPLLVNRAHGAYLAAVRLALSGQIPELPPILRLVLENALYANLIHRDQLSRADRDGTDGLSLQELWLRRDDSQEIRNRVRAEFTTRTLREAVMQSDRTVGARVSARYEQTITDGAHPNPQGVMGALTHHETASGIRLIADILVGDSIPLRYGLVITARTGIDALEVFGLIFPRFEIMSLSNSLKRLKGEHDALARRTLKDMDELHRDGLEAAGVT